MNLFECENSDQLKRELVRRGSLNRWRWLD